MANNGEFIRKNTVLTVDHDRNTRLHYACALNRLDVVEEEIKNGKKIDVENYLGWTPLMMAIRNNHFEIMQFLLCHRADATKINKFDVSVFHLSITSGNLEMVKVILQHLFSGGISRHVMETSLSPISLSVLFNQMNITKYLFEQSFDLNAATPTTLITPLMFAAAIDNKQTIKKLLSLRADATLKNCLGKTAADISRAKHAKVDIKKEVQEEPIMAPPMVDVSSQVPMIMVSETPQSGFQLTPTYLLVEPDNNSKKSSNCGTPLFVHTPSMTPIPPGFHQQVFFPPNFGQVPHMSPIYFNEMLNNRIVYSPYFSPLP